MTDESLQIDDCWNSIGVWSRSGGSCERIKDVIHCRNCDVFIAAGRLIFERESPLAYQQENLAVLAASGTIADGDSVGIIVFRLGAELFALPSGVFELITELKHIHRLPHMKSPYIKGVINISGEVCLCHSFMAVLDIDANVDEPVTDKQHVYKRIAVVRIDGNRYVFPVDEVKGITTYQRVNLKSPPATISEEIKNLVKGAIHMDGDEIAILDAGNIHQLLSRA